VAYHGLVPTPPSRPRSIGAPLAAGLALVLLIVAPPADAVAGGRRQGQVDPGRARPAVAAADPRCARDEVDAHAADELLVDRYRFPPHRTTTLSWPLDWSADPFDDANWRFQLHALAWLAPLLERWVGSRDTMALDRTLAVARDWLAHNPRRDPPSRFSWEEHATALRASTMACLAGALPPPRPGWLTAGLRLHGRVLADPDTPVPAGNHALNQAIGLLDVACVLGRSDWADLAESRLIRLLPESVDRQGVSNEQSVGYQQYVLARWRVAQQHLAVCGRGPLPGAERLDRMVRLLAYATQPDGTYLALGDTYRELADPVAGSIAEFAATGGTSGPRPSQRVARFEAGYLLARTGWGETRPFADEILLGLRFGPGRFLHGHDDGGSLTLHGYGAPLLIDPGLAGYDRGPWRDWFRSREAHDTVTVDGHRSDPTRATRLVRQTATAQGLEAVLRDRSMPGVTHTRRVVFSLGTGIVVVDDRVRAAGSIIARQLWHLPSDADARRTRRAAWTRRDAGNVAVRQLIEPATISLVAGRSSPRQGWVSERWGQVKPAPVVESVAAGHRVRFLTLLVPSRAARPTIRIRALRVTRTGFSVVVEVGGRAERFRATARGASVVLISPAEVRER